MNKLFHKGYFREIFRQLMVPGIVTAAILMLTNVSSALSLLPTLFIMQSTAITSIPSGISLAYPMMIYVFIAGLILTFSAYGWLNKRAQSDFYHAIPVTRLQIYGSSFAAIMIWMLIGLTAYALVHAFLYLITGMPFNYLLFLCVFINMLIGALEVVGGVSIACAISGTRFVNFFAAVVILFMPRFLLTVMAEFVLAKAPYMLDNAASSGIFFDPSYNIFGAPYAPIIETLKGTSTYSVDFAKLPAMLWSFAYSCVLVFLGGVAFVRRSSETAGIPTRSKLFQATVRTAFGLPLLLLFMYTVVSGDATLILGVVLVLFAFIFYCLYELISTKSLKKMAKAMPLFLICIGISLLYLVIPHLIIGIEKNVTADKSNIKGYYIVNEHNSYTQLLGISSGDGSYSDIKQESVEITDDESIGIIAKAYERTKNIDDNIFNSDGSGVWMLVKIDRKIGRNIVRNLYFTGTEYEKLVENMEKNADYAKASAEFPKGQRYFSVSGLSNADAKELAGIYEEEYESLPDSVKRQLNAAAYSLFDFDSYLEGLGYGSGRTSATLNVSGCIGPRNYSGAYYINSNTPRSFEKYISIINQKNGAAGREMLKEIKTWFENGERDDNNYFNIELSGLGSIYYYNTVFSNFGEDKLPKDTDPEYYEIIEMLCSAELTDRSNANAFMVTVSAEWVNPDFSSLDMSSIFTGGSRTIFLNISDEDYSRIVELIRLHDERLENAWNQPDIVY